MIRTAGLGISLPRSYLLHPPCLARRPRIRRVLHVGSCAPWWLIGVSGWRPPSHRHSNLVTTCAHRGVANNWQWWAFLLTGMMTVFFFARLWRRSGVLTDLEFYELRYSGRPARLVRGFRAVYLGLVFNCFIMASVNLAAAKIANVVLGWPMEKTLITCAVLNIIFAATSGIWACWWSTSSSSASRWSAFAAPYLPCQTEVGGLEGLVAQLPAQTISLVPDFTDWGMTLSIFIIPLTIQWWSVWYPGAEPGGGSYIAQRMLAAKSERDALAGTLFFNVAHYALRSWPWIIVALASLVVFPTLDSIRTAFPDVDPGLVGHDMAYPAMLKFLPHGFLGLMIAGMLAAYVSTIVTHLNWGASYLVQDFYRLFVRRGRNRHSSSGADPDGRIDGAGGALTFVLDTAQQSFSCCSRSACTGLPSAAVVLVARECRCEINAMVSSFTAGFTFFIAQNMHRSAAHLPLLGTVALTTLVWVVTALVTTPTDRATLLAFYRQVRPAGPGWKSVREETGLPPSPDSLPQAFIAWMLGCLTVYGALFGTGSFLYGHTTTAIFWTIVFVVSGGWLIRLLPRLWNATPAS